MVMYYFNYSIVFYNFMIGKVKKDVKIVLNFFYWFGLNFFFCFFIYYGNSFFNKIFYIFFVFS